MSLLITDCIHANFLTFSNFLAHVDNEMCLVRALERLGSVALSKEEPDIGAAFLKFSVVTKELSALMKTLVICVVDYVSFSLLKHVLSTDAKHQ